MKRKLEFTSILLNNELISYGRISLKGDRTYLAIGLELYSCGKDIINCYKNVSFKIKDKYRLCSDMTRL